MVLALKMRRHPVQYLVRAIHLPMNVLSVRAVMDIHLATTEIAFTVARAGMKLHRHVRNHVHRGAMASVMPMRFASDILRVTSQKQTRLSNRSFVVPRLQRPPFRALMRVRLGSTLTVPLASYAILTPLVVNATRLSVEIVGLMLRQVVSSHAQVDHLQIVQAISSVSLPLLATRQNLSSVG